MVDDNTIRRNCMSVLTKALIGRQGVGDITRGISSISAHSLSGEDGTCEFEMATANAFSFHLPITDDFLGASVENTPNQTALSLNMEPVPFPNMGGISKLRLIFGR